MSLDCFGNEMSELKNKKLFLFDMDGTIYEEDTVFDGTCQLLEYIEKLGGKYVFITNNSSKSVVDYVNKLHLLGIKADINNFFTSTQATILFLKNYYPNKKVYCQGTRSFVRELMDGGINVTENVETVDVVLIGFDTELTSQKLAKTCEILSTQNVLFIATNPDLRCPVNFGFIPDCGAICQMITHATGKSPTYLGKPEPTMVNFAVERFKVSKEETVLIGDRLYTDIATGINAGVDTVCVLTGEATIADIKNGSIKPTFVLNSVKDVLNTIKK